MPVQCLCHASKWLGRKRSKCIQVVALLKQCGVCMALHVSLAEDTMVFIPYSPYRFLYCYYANVHDTLSELTKVCISWRPLLKLTSVRTLELTTQGFEKPSNSPLAYPKVLWRRACVHLLFLIRIDCCFKKRDASSVNCLPPNESRLAETLPWHKI